VSAPTDDEVVGVHEIAERLKVEKNTVQVWRRRYEDFPAPDYELAMGPAWWWSRVETWKKGRA
jgi:hypothetical protein